MSQWPGFSGLRTYSPELQRDLRLLERSFKEVLNSVGQLTASEPIATTTTAAATLSTQIIAGAGLTGGGDLTSDVTLNVGAGTGIIVNADDIEVDAAYIATLATPGGSDTQLQYNNGGVFGGDADLTWDDTGKLLVVDGAGLSLGLTGNIKFLPNAATTRTISVDDETGTDVAGVQLEILAGSTLNGNADGGALYQRGGDGIGTGNGGNIVAYAGVGYNGGSFLGYGGQSSVSASGANFIAYGAGNNYLGSASHYDGGDMVAVGGQGVNAGSASNGGSVWLVTGEAYVGGNPGTVRITTNSTSTAYDQYILKVTDNTGNIPLAVAYDGTLYSGTALPLSGALFVVGGATVAIPTHCNLGMSFGPKWGANSGVSILTGAFTAAAVGAMFQPTDNLSSTASSLIGGVFTNATIAARTHSNVVGGTFQAATSISTGAFGHGLIAGIYVRGCGTGKSSTATTAYGAYIEDSLTGTTPATTTQYGVRILEQTRGTTKYGLFLDTATAGYKAIAIRDTNTYIHSSAAATLDLTATQTNINSYLLHTGTQVGFYNIGPVARPTAYTQTYSTASRTVPNLTSATLTDSTGGAANTTCVAISGTGDDANVNNNFADIIAQINALRTDVEGNKKNITQIIDDFQANGLLQ